MKHSHPIVAAVYDRMTESDERRVLGRLRADVVGQATGTVIEVGAGTGRNLPHYRAESIRELKVVEPDPYMRQRAESRAATVRFRVDFLDGTAEFLPFPDESADSVVATLVLCSVDRPEEAVRELRRVLKPGGMLLFIEHIRSEEPWRSRLQDWVTPLWRRVAANCHPNRSSLALFEDAGFEVKVSDRASAGFPWIPPIVAGVATRA